MNIHLKRYYTQFNKELKDKGLGATLKKVVTYLYIRARRLATINRRSLNNWKTLKGKYKGKRVFLIGNGPSLNKTPLYLLANEFTMCFNRFNIIFERLSWKPSFYMNVDPLVAEDMAQEINEIVPQVQLAFFPDIHTHGLDYRTFIKDANNVQWMFPQFKGFYFDLPNVALGGTVAYPALQVLTYLGFSEIYLIGVDMNYQIHTTVKDIKGTDVASTGDDDPNHFDPRYFGTNRKYHQPVTSIVDNIMTSFEYAADKIKQNTQVKVFNAGIGSKVECFEKVKFEGLFNHSEQEAFSLFIQPFAHILNYRDFEQMKSEIPVISSANEVQDDSNYFLCEMDLGLILIKKLVYAFISFGPYQNKILFISRKNFGTV